MRPPFAYPGGKARLAQAIVSRLPDHRVYVEPFAGALSVLLAKPRVGVEMANDLDGDVVNWWRCLRDRPDELIAALAATPYARDEYNASWTDTDDPVEQARRWWVRVQQGVAHKFGSKSGWQCSASDGRGSTSKASTVWRKVKGLDAIADRLVQVLIENRPAVDVIEMMDSPHTLFYLDPPYLPETFNSKGGGAYRHTMTVDDHRELAQVLMDARGAVVLSGYPSPLYEELYDGWDRAELTGRADTANRSGADLGRVEVLWSNRDLLSIEPLALFEEVGGRE